jgi:anthranilate synthase component I
VITRQLPGRRDLLALAAALPERYPCLLESVADGSTQSRFDILFAYPQDSIRLDSFCDKRKDHDFLAALDSAWTGERQPRTRDDLPFRGGWVLYLGYELAGQIEPRLRLPPAPSPGIPVALALRCPAAIIVDRLLGTTVLMAEVAWSHLLDRLAEDTLAVASLSAPPAFSASVREDDTQAFVDGVERIHEYLIAGDVFQVNLSREWRAQLQPRQKPADLYALLRRANPSPFAGLLQYEDWAIVSSSPERLIAVNGASVQTRPIAGTRARFSGDDDAAKMRELIGHPKERAEHVMLIDLERNDLGRVCIPGSIQVDELMSVESYAHVHHIVSNVRGLLRPGITPGTAIRAVFPGGTITGCPKVRCMEIIAELERVGRGPYTGALGYLNRDGDMDLNILIRTLVVDRDDVRLRAGAGIVIDSDPQRELDETRAKARGMLRALGIAA